MNIIFLCGSLEPGRDGVGDYTRRLAGELIRQGHKACIVGLNDKYSLFEFNGVQVSEGLTLPVLRLPSNWSQIKRFQRAGLWIDDFNPEWISLQFVPFSFHSKGLALGIGKFVKTLGKSKRLHIMIHELWVGMDEEAPFKFVCWGWLQKQLIRSVLVKLKPNVIHTQAGLYMKMLEKIGFKSQYLPLFGNIPVKTPAGKLSDEEILHENFSKTISFVVFGGIHPGAPIGQLAKELKVYSIEKGIPVLLKMIGRSGPEQQRWKEEWESAGLPVKILGEQSTETISGILASSSFGISTTPDSLVEKSGSVAAMREHGLSILCISRRWNPRGVIKGKLPEGIIQYQQGKIEGFITNNFKANMANSISSVTRQFASNLLSSL